MIDENGMNKRVGIVAYLSLIFAILFFSGIFKDFEGPIRAMDFSNLSGSFGTLGSLEEGAGALAANFRGMGGNGAKDGFLFAITLWPPVIFALGMVQIIEDLGGLQAAQKLMTPLLRPLMGLPGICGLGVIATLQSSDAVASMTNVLLKQGQVKPKEHMIFCAFQFSAGGTITNYFSSGAALFPFFVAGVTISTPLLVILIFKMVSANLIRLYANLVVKEGEPYESN